MRHLASASTALVLFWTGCATCPRYVHESGGKISVSAIKVPELRADIGSVEIQKGTNPAVTDELMRLDAVQYYYCQHIQKVSTPSKREQLRLKLIATLECLQKTTRAAEQGASAPLPDCSMDTTDDWRSAVQWCWADRETPIGCEDEYRGVLPECLRGGGRSCLMKKAIDLAKQKECEKAFNLVGICQCHNVEKGRLIAAAGREAVCSYLQGL